MKVDSTLNHGNSHMNLTKAILIYEEAISYHPDAVLSIRELEREGVETRVGGDIFVSLHEVEEDAKGRALIGVGQPLQRGRLEELLRQLAGTDRKARQLLPNNLLYHDATMLLWHAPGRKQTIYFSTADKPFNADVSGRTVAHPPLLFKATPTMLSVWALTDDARPTLETQLMVAPYCNLYEKGAMCRGDVKLPPSIAPSTIPAWEAMFYDSRFTHSNLRGQMTTHEGGHNALWRQMVDAEQFDVKYLLPAKATVGDLLK